LGIIVMTQSRTAWLITIGLLAFSAVLHLLGRMAPKERLLVILIMLVVAAALGLAFYAISDQVLALAGRDSSLSGRKEIWAALWLSILKRPVLGYGYRAFWLGLTGESANVIIAIDWVTGYAHNGFLAVWSELGGVGLVLFLLTFFKGLRDAATCFYLGRPSYVDWYITTLIFLPIYNYTEANIMFPFQLIWVLYVVTCVGLDRTARERRQMLAAAKSFPAIRANRGIVKAA